MNKIDFPILAENIHNKPFVYLDNAATTQKPKAVLDEMYYAYTHWNANVHRGTHYLSLMATEKHEYARKQVAKFFNANSEKEIVFTKGTTDSINLLAKSFGEAYINEGDEIIISSMEHHSNIVPWQMLCRQKKAILKIIPLNKDLSIDIEKYEQLFTTKTKIVSVTHVSNVLGIINPIKQIIQIAHKHNVPVMIDGAQSAPHLQIDLQELDCDFFACSSHKMYGPLGIGILYGKKSWLDSLPPVQGGGEMIKHVTFEKTIYEELPYKFEAGTPNFIETHVFAKTLEYINEIGMANINKHDKDLIQYAEIQLKQIDNINIYGENLTKSGIISFNVNNIHHSDIGVLLDQQGIAVRTGHHCAEPLINLLGVNGVVRISFGLYNDKEDIDIFITALKRAITLLN